MRLNVEGESKNQYHDWEIAEEKHEGTREGLVKNFGFYPLFVIYTILMKLGENKRKCKLIYPSMQVLMHEPPS